MDIQTHHKAESLIRKIRDLESEQERLTLSIKSEPDAIKIGDRFSILKRTDSAVFKSVIEFIENTYKYRLSELEKEFEML